MYAEISSAISSAKTLIDLLAGAKSLARKVEIDLAVTDILQRLQQALTLVAEVEEKRIAQTRERADMLREIDDLRAQVQQKKKYALCKLPSGQHVYVLESDAETNLPEHYFCKKCVDSQVDAILDLIPIGTQFRYVCSVCRKNYLWRHNNTS